MSKVKGRAIAFVMAFCLLFTGAFTNNIAKVDAATEGTGTLTNCTILVEGEKLTENTVIKNGDNLELEFNWSLSNNDQTSTEFVVDLGEIKGIKLNTTVAENPLKQGSETVGTYYISDNKLYINLYKEHPFFDENERIGGVNVEGIVQVDDNDVNDEDETTIGVGSYTFTVKYDDETVTPVPWVSVDKALSGELTQHGGELYQTFGVVVTAHDGNVNNLVFTDTPGSALSFMNGEDGSIQMTGVFTGNYNSMDAVNAALESVTLKEGETINLSYMMKVSEDVYKENTGYSDKNNVFETEYTPEGMEETKTATDAVAIEVSDAPGIQKNGSLSADQKTATWNIIVDLGRFYDENKTLAELLDYVQDTPGIGFASTELVNLDLSTFTDNGDGTFSYTYTTAVADNYVDIPSNTVLKNNVQMQIKGKPGFVYTDVGTVDLVGKSWINKEAQATVDADGYIVWDVTLDIPTGVTDIILWDDLVNNGDHAFVDGVYVDGEKVATASGIAYDYNGIYTEKAPTYLVDLSGEPVKAGASYPHGMELRLSNDYIKDKTQVVLTYKTKIINEYVETFYNKIKMQYKCPVIGTTTHEDTATFVDNTEKIITKKNAKVGEDGFSTNYTICVDMSKKNACQAGDVVIVSDILPEGMFLDESVSPTAKSGHCYGTPWSEVSYILDKEILADGRQKLLFTLTLSQANIDAFDWDFPGFQVAFVAEPTDADKQEIYEKGIKTYQNTAEVTYGTLSAEATNVLDITCPDVVTKTGTYDEWTAPDCEYVVEINKECLDLVDGDTLMGVDTMGSLVTYTKDSMKVEKNTADGWVTMDAGKDYCFTYEGDDEGKKLIITGLPDETYLRISYSARLELRAQTDINPPSFEGKANNSFTLQGIKNGETGTDEVIMTTAIKASGWAGSTDYSIYLNKYWTDASGQMHVLNGAKFRVEKMKVTAEGLLETDAVIHESITIGEDAEAGISGLVVQNIYALYEIEAPLGYEKNSEPYYFVLQESMVDLSAVDSSIVIHRFTETSTIWYENSKAEGTLEITKEFSVAEPETADLSKIKFTISPQIGEKETYTLDEFDKGTDGTYTKLFENVPIGDYKVTENRVNINGYIFEKMEYTVTVDGTQQSSGSETATDTVSTQIETPVQNGKKTVVALNNTYALETVEVSGSKIWEDDNDAAGKRPESIMIHLYADSELKESKKVTAADEWKWSFTNLPKYAAGQEIEYTITEGDVPLYDEQVNGNDVTNVYNPGKTNISVTKVWEDSNNRDGIRPESVEVQLKADSTNCGEKVTLDADNNWSYEWTDLNLTSNGKLIEYTLEEVNVPDGYTSEVTGDASTGFVVTNTHELETVRVSVSKVWDDADNQDGIRPDSVTVQLLADGVAAGVPVELNAANGWSYKWDNLHLKSEGEKIKYTVDEVNVPGYEVSIKPNESSTGYIITNTHIPETVDVAGEKTWDDNNNASGNRPDSITISLLANGKEIDSKAATAEDGWKWSFDNLPKYAAGTEIVYSIDEKDVLAYTKQVNDYNVTNTYVPNTGKLIITKVIEGDASRTEVEDTVKFVVTDSNDKKTEYTLKDFVYSAASGTYTLTLSVDFKGIGGIFTVEETVYDIEGYEAAVKYAVNNGTKVVGNEATVVMERSKDSTVSFVNTYTKVEEPSTSTSPAPTDGPTTSTPPETSEEPGTSTSPAPTDGPTTSTPPETSEEPSTSASPVPTDDPITSTPPETSEEPGTSTSPAPTDGPTTSTPPETSEEPGASTSPTPSSDPTTSTPPETSEEPGTSTSPAPTDGPTTSTPPGTTSKPTPTQAPTQVPTVVTTPAPTQAPTPTPVPVPVPVYDDMPKTDDEAPVGLWLTLMFSSLAGMIMVCACAWKRRQNEEEQ